MWHYWLIPLQICLEAMTPPPVTRGQLGKRGTLTVVPNDRPGLSPGQQYVYDVRHGAAVDPRSSPYLKQDD